MTDLSLIVAYDRNRLIGINGDLPWRLPKDLQHFKALTLGKTVLMGRKTWDSLPRRPLPDRANWVLSRSGLLDAAGAQSFQTLAAAIERARALGLAELVVIGGAQLYEQSLPLARTLYLTEVDAAIAPSAEAEAVYFPALELSAYRCTHSEAHVADERHGYAFTFKTLERIA